MRRSKKETAEARGRPMRWAIFRLGAVMVGLAPFLLAEAALTFLDWGRPTSFEEDPFVSFRAVRPLFVLNEEGTRYEVPQSRQAYFRPESFAANKGSDEFRIFCLGGSTVQGRPYAIETSFTTWLQIALEAAQPERRWRVVNCGGVSYASYRLVPILEEVLDYDPDLILVYTGQNEFLEDRTYRHIKQMPGIVAEACAAASQTRTYTLARQAYLRARGERTPAAARRRPVLETEVDAMLQYRGGLDQYHRDEKWRLDTIEHYRYNLGRMVQMTHDAGVGLVLLNPVCNLRDCAPFKTQHRDALRAEELEAWDALVRQAADSQGSDLLGSVAFLEEALAIDDQHAGLHFLLAKCLDGLGRHEEARASYIRAKELDICPLRILEPMNRAVLAIARQTGTPVVDVRQMYDEFSDAGIPGGYLLVDHIHPSVAGHQLIGTALAEELAVQGIVHPGADWEEMRDRRFRAHLASLDDFYYAIGQERLEALRLWTMGKAGRTRPGPGEEPTDRGEPQMNTDEHR